MSRSCPPTLIADFVRYLIEAGETEGLTRRDLWLLFGEFCLATGSDLPTEAQLLRHARAAGLERYRISTGSRRWLYCVRSAEVVQLPDRKESA
jgi:hypothetical protein